MITILFAIALLGCTGAVAAMVLYVVSRKFVVPEDVCTTRVTAVLPQANCGGCGFPGCAGFAAACVKAASLEGLHCPVGGQPVMEKVAAILGLKVEATEESVAVIRCNGTSVNRNTQTIYDGVRSCAVAHATSGGSTGCAYGCLGCADCVQACPFGAIRMQDDMKLPVVDEACCTACGICVENCPRKIIEIRPKGKNNRRVYVCCVNCDEASVATASCTVSCNGCGTCVEACPFGAVTLHDHLAYIDPHACRLCRKCEIACPQHAIVAVNFPPHKGRQTRPEVLDNAASQ